MLLLINLILAVRSGRSDTLRKLLGKNVECKIRVLAFHKLMHWILRPVEILLVVVQYMLYLYHRLECFAWYIRTSPRAAHECLWYKCCVPRCPCRLIARQYGVETRIYYIDPLGKFDYGPAHASRNHRYTYVCQQKRANPMGSVESSYKRLNSCFVAIASFHKVYYTSKGLTFFLKQVSRVFRKMGVVLN